MAVQGREATRSQVHWEGLEAHQPQTCRGPSCPSTAAASMQSSAFAPGLSVCLLTTYPSYLQQSNPAGYVFLLLLTHNQILCWMQEAPGPAGTSVFMPWVSQKLPQQCVSPGGLMHPSSVAAVCKHHHSPIQCREPQGAPSYHHENHRPKDGVSHASGPRSASQTSDLTYCSLSPAGTEPLTSRHGIPWSALGNSRLDPGRSPRRVILSKTVDSLLVISLFLLLLKSFPSLKVHRASLHLPEGMLSNRESFNRANYIFKFCFLTLFNKERDELFTSLCNI